MRTRFAIGSFLAFTLLTACASTPETPAQNPKRNHWESKKGDCENVLSVPYGYDLSKVTYCTRVWEMHRYVDDLPLKVRSMYAVAFSRVSYDAADPYDRAIADAALMRLCIPRHPRNPDGTIREEIPDKLDCDGNFSDLKIAVDDPYMRMKGTVPVEEIPAADAANAESLYKKAVAERKKNARKAINLYREALRANPYHVNARYDLAAVLVAEGNTNGALRELEELYKLRDPEAEMNISKARTDESFANIRDELRFKLMTGYVRINLVNCARDLGIQHVASIKSKLESKHLPVTTVSKSETIEGKPKILYREGFDAYAEQVRDAMGISKISVLVNKDPGEDDILILWGQKEAVENYGVGQNAPVVHNKNNRAQGSDNMLKDVTDTVNQNKQSVDKLHNTVKSINQSIKP